MLKEGDSDKGDEVILTCPWDFRGFGCSLPRSLQAGGEEAPLVLGSSSLLQSLACQRGNQSHSLQSLNRNCGLILIK